MRGNTPFIVALIHRIDEWVGQLSKNEPVVTFYVYGLHVGCTSAITLRAAGFGARYMKGGHAAWKAIGGQAEHVSLTAASGAIRSPVGRIATPSGGSR